MNLTDFLLARIAEDEEAVTVARAYATGPMGGSAAAPAIVITRPDGYRLWSTDQLLAECEAKRAIVGSSLSFQHAYECADSLQSRLTSAGAVAAFEVAMKFLALPYADHPDYDERWRP